MRLIGALRSWLAGDGDATRDAPATPEGQPMPVSVEPAQPQTPEPLPERASVEARQERLASHLLDDERLRGDLTDDAFQPLLNSALQATDRLAASTADLDDAGAEQVLDAGLTAIKQVMQVATEAVAAHEAGDTASRDRALADLRRLTSEESVRTAFWAGGSRASRLLAPQTLLATSPDVTELSQRIAAALERLAGQHADGPEPS